MMTMTCKNCGQQAADNFCAYCGQSTKVDKINLSNFLSELSGSIFQLNKGFFYTLKELFIRPGHSIREYLNGKRKSHFKPVAYVFTLSTIYFLLSQLTENETFIGDFITGWSEGASGSDEDAAQLGMLSWFAKHYAYTVLLLIPLFSLASYLSFLNFGFNYLEHCVLNAYVTGQQAIFYAFYSLFGLMADDLDFLTFVTLIISISYNYFVFGQFFYKHSRKRIIFRLTLAYVLYLVVITLVMIFVLLLLKLFLK